MLIYVLLSIAWLAALVVCVATALLQGFFLLAGNRPSSMALLAWSTIGAGVLSAPLWLEATALEIKCRQAGLTVTDSSSYAPNEGIFWRSHDVNPHAYSSGIRLGSHNIRHAFTINVLRALAEGRVAYVEVPFEPQGDPHRMLNQKLYLAMRSVAPSQCLASPLDTVFDKLPAKYCIAWQTVQNLNTRYELVGVMGENQVGTVLSILDRKTDRTLGKYSYVTTTRATETLLSIWGIHSLQPRSCTPVMTDIRPAATLLALIFPRPDGNRLDINELEQYEKSPWVVANPSSVDTDIPEGMAGIEFWIAKGKVRHLIPTDLDLWRSAMARDNSQQIANVPHNAYLVEGSITLPANLTGAHAVTWVLRPGQPIPQGPRGHSTFLEIGRGCVWEPFRCK